MVLKQPASHIKPKRSPPTAHRIFHDWTRDPLHPDIVLTPFQKLLRDVDWNVTLVGPMYQWPAWLRQQVLIMVADSKPGAILVGDHQTIIYNEAHSKLIGDKHPILMGQDPHIGLVELWDKFHDIIKNGERTGTSFMGRRQLVPMVRYGYLEETYYHYNFTPIVGEDGYVVGNYWQAGDAIHETIRERRTLLTLELSKELLKCTDMAEFWPSFLKGLSLGDKDFPLVALYAVSQFGSEPTCSQSGRTTCLLEACIGIDVDKLPSRLVFPRGHHPPSSILTNIDKLLVRLFQASLEDPKPLLLTRNMLPSLFLAGITWRGFGVPSEEFLIVPMRTRRNVVIGFMFAGLNPMKRYRQDHDYEDFIKIITQQIAIPRASSLLQSEEIRKGEERLILQSAELKRSEAKYRNFAEHAPIGVALVAPDRCIEFANEAWFKITEQPRDDTETRPWRRVIHADDFARFDAFVDDLLTCKGLRIIEARLQREWAFRSEEGSTDSAEHTAWILASGYSELNADGSLGYAVIWITDISSQKAVERSLDVRMKKALDLKRQQENFVDNICHEIRNPASAMLHCADEIASYLEDCLNATADILDSSANTLTNPTYRQIPEWLRSSLDATRTIVTCVNHQRSIVDDVLTLSKLDSNLLSLSPAIVDPVKIITEALKLFQGEMRNAGIKWTIYQAASLKDLNAEWVLLDSGRIHQIIINLVTNAIKFTRNCEQREINVRISAVQSRPTMSNLGVDYFPTSEHRRRNVTDTGKGLSSQEKSNLFERFAQGNPKTHTQYGGSGLGLWISREITEMMDGEIGVASEEGIGSTFTFFVKTQLAVPSPEQDSNKQKLGITSPLNRSPSPAGDPVLSNVLVVEDNLVNQKVLCTALKKRGYNVLAANNGVEALETIYRTSAYSGSQATLLEWPPFDVILMDIEMPHMDGVTCIRKIRALEAEGKIEGHQVTIAVTANARPDHVNAAIEAGMDGVTTKPYRMDDLVAQMDKTFLRTHRTRRVNDEDGGDESISANASGEGEGTGNNYAYLVTDEKTKESVIIDPANPPEVLPVLKQQTDSGNIKLTNIVNTHHHRDHAGGNGELLKQYPLPIIGGKDCDKVTKTPSHNSTFKIGEGIKVTALHTPCHTQDSICYYMEDGNDRAVFTGDTLFIGGCGRFFEGNAKEMHKALNEVLAGLPDDTKVYPGHEYTKSNILFGLTISQDAAMKNLESFANSNKETQGKFTIGDEKKHNVFMRVNDAEIQKKVGETDPISVMTKLRELKNSM
ncbi:putative histidine kinase M2QJp [Venturia nashicola]|uniref:histidine kinase n=1 Tax=Venturia nashicola TaxID=86259 RepID=A0A4Z1P3Q1_9PEZI|nr:putative histidine kinase M2QJp [Venturia nashicola]